jgi:hypothetical protein
MTQMTNKASEEPYVCTPVFGFAMVESFFRVEHGCLVGYGRVTHYDRDGVITSVNVSATGLEMKL